MIPGDGVGPELMTSVKNVFSAAKVPVKFDEIDFHEINHNEKDFDDLVDSIKQNKVCIMGIIKALECNSLLTQDLVKILKCKFQVLLQN